MNSHTINKIYYPKGGWELQDSARGEMPQLLNCMLNIVIVDGHENHERRRYYLKQLI
jgi:hypothetical protein